MRTSHQLLFLLSAVVCALPGAAAPRKPHTVVLGAARKVPYDKVGDPAGAAPGEDSLRIRALLVDGQLKEWTCGEAHDVTDRSFVVRRVLRINDALPGDALPGDSLPEQTLPGDTLPAAAQQTKPAKQAKPAKPQSRWVWQRGPWLLVDRVTGHIAPLKLPDYDPAVSQVSWFRDYAAYCGVTASGKSLYAVVAQVAGRKPVLAKKLEAFEAARADNAACGAAEWQREPLRITFHPVGRDAVSFDVVPGSAVLVEEASDAADEPAAKAKD